MPKSVLEDAKSAKKAREHVPYSPRTRAESCLLNFTFDLDRVHKLIAEAEAKFQRGETANKCKVSYCDFPASGYQLLLKLKCTNFGGKPSIDLKSGNPSQAEGS